MRTLDEIVTATRSALPVTEEELRRAVVAFDVLIYALDLSQDYARMGLWFEAAEADPIEYAGEANSPDNADAVAWYRAMQKVGEPTLCPPMTTDKDKTQKDVDMKNKILAVVEDLAIDFLCYDRKEDEEVTESDIENAFKNGHITREEIVKVFSGAIEKWERNNVESPTAQTRPAGL